MSSVAAAPTPAKGRALKAQGQRGTAVTSPSVLLVANRIGELNGETGGGSVFRQKLFEGLKLTDFDVKTLSAGRLDIGHTESVRGPLMSASLHNLLVTVQAVWQQDLVVVSGSWSFLTFFAVFVALLCGVPCITFVTMNSRAAVDSCFKGLLWCLAVVLYLVTDFCNCWLSVAAYTRSEEYCRKLRERGVPIRGVVFCSDQYDAFRKVDSPAVVAGARQILSGGQPNKPLLLYCGRLLQEKRIPLLIAAKPEDAVLAIVGSGVAADALQCFHNPKEGIVCHFGKMVPQSELRVFYKAADIHVSASNFETLGNTVHEALLCGCPVVVQRAGGYVSQVSNGSNGYLVDWEDACETQSAIASVLRGELARVVPLQRDVVDAFDVVRTHAGRRRRLLARVVAFAGAPLVAVFWVLARVYEHLAELPRAQTRSGEQRCDASLCR